MYKRFLCLSLRHYFEFRIARVTPGRCASPARGPGSGGKPVSVGAGRVYALGAMTGRWRNTLVYDLALTLGLGVTHVMRALLPPPRLTLRLVP